jgi:ABC-type phosphate transport system substrate-binding protein
VHLFKNIIAGTLLALAMSGTALAEVVVVVSSKSPVVALSKIQIADIFLGKTRRFPEGTPAVAIDQVDGSAARDEFYMRLTGKTAAQLTAYWSKIIFTGRGLPPSTVANSVEVKKRIIENPATIGYIDRSLVDGTVKVLF